jgi:hypothetical protein
LPRLAKILSSEDFGQLTELLFRTSNEAVECDVIAHPLLHQLFAGELALTLAVRLPDAKSRRRMEKSGRAAVALGLVEILDNEGMPAADHFDVMLPLLACWTRCAKLAKESGSTFRPRTQRQLDRFIRNFLRLVRPDGQPSFDGGNNSSVRKLLDTALQISTDPTNRLIAAVALRPTSGKASKTKKGEKLPAASLHCEESGLAVLRRDWNHDSERLVTRFAGRSCDIELTSSNKVVMSGEWQFSLSTQGRQLEPVSDWESICWHSDAEVDYLELQMQLAEGVTLQRHLVLARQDRFLLLADAVLGTNAVGVEYCGILPLATGVKFSPAEETREGTLAGAGRPLAHVLPLALPEWRSDTRVGQLDATARGLELRQESEGRRLFAPLFIDLDRARFRKRLTWRTLTVAEALHSMSAERAVGYRVAVGKEQWLVYRALGVVGNRTLLGHNLSTETLVARFGADGEVTSIIEIE